MKLCQNFMILNSKPFPSMEFMDASTTATGRMTPDLFFVFFICFFQKTPVAIVFPYSITSASGGCVNFTLEIDPVEQL